MLRKKNILVKNQNVSCEKTGIKKTKANIGSKQIEISQKIQKTLLNSSKFVENESLN